MKNKKVALMETISNNDIIFADAFIKGTSAASLRLNGLSSISDVIRAIRREVGTFSGLLTISMRNMTQGWASRKSLYITPEQSKDGTQLTLF